MLKKIYGLVSVFILLISISYLSKINYSDNIIASIAVEIVLIVYLIKISWGCSIYVREQYKNKKYSYSIVMNLGLLLFLILNTLRHINLLIINSKFLNINEIYNNTLNSFSYFAYFTLPFIIILSVYSIIANVVLIKREGFRLQNLLGVVFTILIALLVVLSQMAFMITKSIDFFNHHIYIKRFLDIGINSVLCYYYCLTIATLFCIIVAARFKPNYDKDYVIILGSRVRKDGTLPPILQARVDKAIEFAKEQNEITKKSIIFIPSGGKGQDEDITEAEAMEKYLVEKGIEPKNIIIENQAKNTAQNFIFSKRIIDESNNGNSIIFSTTNYHVFRSGVIAWNEGVECEGIGSKTKWYFYINALIREFFANLFIQRKQHFILITFINIALFILVFVGYKYNLI